MRPGPPWCSAAYGRPADGLGWGMRACRVGPLARTCRNCGSFSKSSRPRASSYSSSVSTTSHIGFPRAIAIDRHRSWTRGPRWRSFRRPSVSFPYATTRAFPSGSGPSSGGGRERCSRRCGSKPSTSMTRPVGATSCGANGVARRPFGPYCPISVRRSRSIRRTSSA